MRYVNGRGTTDLRLGRLPIGAIPGNCERYGRLVDVNGLFHGVGVELDGADGPRADAFDMETLAELPQWADEQIDFDLAVLAVQVEVLLPLHVLGVWNDRVAESIQGGGDRFHAFEIAEHVRANKKIKVVGGPRHRQLREERPFARLIELACA